MGHSANSDVVPFKLYLGWNFEAYPDTSMEVQFIMCAPETWKDWREEEHDEEGLAVPEMQGWAYQPWDENQEDVGKHGVLSAKLWKKGEHRVWLVNEDPYSNVGYYDCSACAKDQQSLEQFIEDFGDLIDEPKIEEMEAVMSYY